jgi:hypothetical protein
MVFLIAGISGCGRESEPLTPVGDWIEWSAGESRTDGILIDTVHEDDEWFGLSWWECNSDGYVWKRNAGISKTTPSPRTPRAVIASPVERQKMIAHWQELGYAARITDVKGKTSEVSNVFLAYNPPPGYRWQYGGQTRETSIRIMVDGTEQTIDFKSISELALEDGEVKLPLHEGGMLSGVHVPYTYNNLTFSARLFGFQYDSDGRFSEFDIPLESVSYIVFLTWPDSE